MSGTQPVYKMSKIVLFLLVVTQRVHSTVEELKSFTWPCQAHSECIRRAKWRHKSTCTQHRRRVEELHLAMSGTQPVYKIRKMELLFAFGRSTRTQRCRRIEELHLAMSQVHSQCIRQAKLRFVFVVTLHCTERSTTDSKCSDKRLKHNLHEIGMTY